MYSKILKNFQSTPNPFIIEKELKIENDVEFLGVRLNDGLGWSQKLENTERKLFILHIYPTSIVAPKEHSIIKNSIQLFA